MPSYDPAGISIHLGATALAPTITHDPRLRKNEAAKKTEGPDKLLRESKRLDESYVPHPGDNQGFRVGFLKNVPFLQVQAGQTLWIEDGYRQGEEIHKTTQMRTPSVVVQEPRLKDENAVHASSYRGTQERVTRAHPNASPMIAPPQPRPSLSCIPSLFAPDSPAVKISPKALALHVTLSEKTFLPSFEGDKPQMLMIDVFFNGMLASSVLMHLRDINSGAKGMHQIFTGHRVDFLIERPWVIHPPNLDSSGEFRRPVKTGNPKQRWNQICTALLKNADDRGFNKWNERPPSADYLQSLADMEMPDQVRAMQKPGGRCFGVVDVVVTAGNGQKVFSSYLNEPTMMPDSRYKHKKCSVQTNEVEVSGRQNDRRMSSLRTPSNQGVGQPDPQPEQEPPVLPSPSTWRSFPLPLHNDNLPPWGSDFPSHRDSSFMDFSSIASPKPLLISNQLPSTFHSSSGNEPAGTVNPLNLELIPSSLSSSRVPASVDEASALSFDPMAPPHQNLPTAFGIGDSNQLQDAESISNSSHGFLNKDHVYVEGGPLLPSTPGLAKFPYFGPVRHVGPFPPIGRFSVPKSSSAIDPGYIDSSQPRASELISRAVITSKGKVIVDHRWPIAQRVANKSNTTMRKRSLTHRRENSPGSTEYTEISLSSRRHSKIRRRTRLETPPPTSSGSFGVENLMETATAAGKDSHTNDMLNNQEQQCDGAAPNELNKSTSYSTELAQLPPKQGPKSNPYIIDDPEKILRNDTKAGQDFALIYTPAQDGKRASRSAHRTFVEPTVPVKMRTTPMIDPLKSEAGSLLTVPNISELKLAAEPGTQVSDLGAEFSGPVAQHPSATYDTAKGTLANFRGSILRSNPVPALRPPHTPAPSLNAMAFHHSATSPTSTPATASDSAKKRKRTRVDDIKTSDNPPLNQGCVIAFAESGEGEAAVLRQVKCEKQGEFTEDMVVCGMRFFIAG